MTVGRICTREVHLADLDEKVRDVAQRMAERNVGALVVLDGERRPLGIVTDRDLVVSVLASDADPGTMTLRDIVIESPYSVPEDTPIEDALEQMRLGPFRRLPVVDAEGRLAGIVSLDDVLMLMAEEFETIGRILRRQAEPPLPLPLERRRGARPGL